LKTNDNFNKHKSKKSGLRSWCKSCEKGLTPTGDAALDLIVRLKKQWKDEGYQKRTKGKMSWTDFGVAEWFCMLVGQQGCCAISGVKLTPENISIDHIVPVVNGGTHELRNLRLVSWGVNQGMNSMDDQSFIELCRQVINHQLDLLIYGDKKTSEANLPTEAECISLDADPDLG
jgi:hypothetical protein